MASTGILTFGPFHLDLRAEQLWRGAEVLPLPPRTFAVLRYLVLHAGTLVTRDAILEAIWGTQYVSDAALASCIRDIRQALGEQAQTPQFLETVRGRGFRFLAPVSTAAALPLSPAPRAHPSSVVRAPTLVVGRDAELARLQSCLDCALRGDRQIVFITGEPGIGKTTLVDAFLSTLPMTSQALWITRGQCVEHYGVGEAYLPVLEALGRLGQEADAATIVAVLAQYAPTWLTQLPALVSVPEREGLQRTLQGATPARMLREFADALEAMTTCCPVVLVLEDLHWSDPSSVELLAYVAQRRGLARLLVLATYRPVDVLASAHPLHGAVQELQARGHCQEVRLGFLPPVEVEAYVRGRLACETTPPAVDRLATAVHQWTGGNPLFMVTMLEHLLQEGVVTAEAGQWHVSQDSTAWHRDIPDSVRQLITKQFASLRPEEQQVLEAASVAGAEFAVAAVAAGLDHPVDTIETWCAALATKQQFLYAAGVEAWPDGTLAGRYRFVHALYHQTIYDRLAAAHRLHLHRRIGMRKERAYDTRVREIAAELAEHFVRGQDTVRAVQYLQYAGEQAVQRSAYQEALQHLTQGLALLTTLPETPARDQQELGVYLALGPVLMASRGVGASEVERTYTQARMLSHQIGTPAQRFSVLWGLWRLYHGRAQHQNARQVGEDLLTLAQSLHDPALLLAAYQALGSTCYFTGDFVLARTYLEQGLACYHAQPQAAVAFHVSIVPAVYCLDLAAQTLWTLGYPDQALLKSQEATTLAQTLAHAQSLAFAQYYAARLHGLRRELVPTARFAEATLTLTTAQGFPYYHGLALFLRGWVTAMEGQGEAGVAQMHQGVQEVRRTGAALGQPFFLTLLAEIHDTLGQIDTARHLLADVDGIVAANGQRGWAAETARLQGLLCLHQAEPDVHQAEVNLQQALRIARQQQAKSWELRAALSLSRLWQQQGKGPEARQLLEDLYGWFNEGFDTADLQEVAALLRILGSQGTRPPSATPPGHTALASSIPAVAVSTASPGVLPVGQSVPPTAVPTPTPLPSDALLWHEGDYWTLIFQGTTCRVKNTYGMHYLAQLLRAPQHEIHVLALVRGSTSPADVVAPAAAALPARQAHLGGFSDAGEVLDASARDAYKQRLAVLQAELAEAQAWNDPSRSTALQAEIEFLTQELLQAVGHGSRARKTASPAERARVNVTRAIRGAITRIATLHPACGQYLAQTIHTGTFCVYTPDPQAPLTWQVSSILHASGI